MDVKVKTLFCVVLLSVQSTISTTSVVNNIDDNLKTDSSGLTPYKAHFYDLLNSADIFDKSFNVSLSPQEAAKAFELSSFIYTSMFNFTKASFFIRMISQAGERAYSRGVDDLAFFKINTNTMENYLWKKGIMNLNNMKQLAYLYYETLMKSLISEGSPKNSIPKVVFVTEVNANYLRSFGQPSINDITYQLLKFTEEIDGS